ncbi:hypothetical protein [Pseudoxanthomonas putridarboris]|uniref:Metallo-beta-lactamase domain-containing protein n=1 Tax=Pseudoxanthomonas putridarboris TaxID=752605 RepID=A0ABU9J040_9GAMM
MTAPKSIRIRMYQVGFGDCFLLSFDYAPKPSRHVLIDCGSMASPKGSAPGLIKRVAASIAGTVGDEPFAVVATHRHTDHVSGFDPGANGKGAGAIIAALKPKFVVQPWTEDPSLPVDAEAPAARRGMALRRKTLDDLNVVASQIVDQYVPRLRRSQAVRGIAGQLDFIGKDNIKNLRAVENLMTMAPNDYVHAGRATRLTRFLPGVRVHVLGPPTIGQYGKVRGQRARDEEQFWHLQARSLGMGARVGLTRSDSLFKGFPSAPGRHAPVSSRWLINAMKSENAEQLLQLVRILDDAMNNTSLILLFECGDRRLLFPGDAQIENWEYALKTPSLRKHLEKISVYKVGHHGSLNATPKSLWKIWFPEGGGQQGAGRRMVSLLSTLEGKHGKRENDSEVPRRKLVDALKSKTTMKSTESIGEAEYHDEVIAID